MYDLWKTLYLTWNVIILPFSYDRHIFCFVYYVNVACLYGNAFWFSYIWPSALWGTLLYYFNLLTCLHSNTISHLQGQSWNGSFTHFQLTRLLGQTDQAVDLPAPWDYFILLLVFHFVYSLLISIYLVIFIFRVHCCKCLASGLKFSFSVLFVSHF